MVAVLFSEAVKKITRKAGLSLKEVDLIGSHGQTIQHLPIKQKMFGKTVHATMQIGNPSVIAKLTGIVTVGDFRVGDIAVGGTGAPLIPLFDFLMFRSSKFNRALLNIGGIANITILPKKCTISDVFAFDTGPGNMIVDGLMQHFYNKSFDKNGSIALKGKILPLLENHLVQHLYFKTKPPKSTGRESFGNEFIRAILRKSRREKKEDVITTATELTALSIYLSYLKFVRPTIKLDELLVSGGGVHNRYIMQALRRYFDRVNIRAFDELNFSSDAKEAICFAVLANETISGNPGNVPGATGAKKQTILGTICLP
ncbi:MAG: anhydro-N-acetylmuramic acid kinase [Ignavibacteriales bacterium]|nr:anhydro-N-acetylmuramic acid kinase [Ignavibacteriales bacterium]